MLSALINFQRLELAILKNHQTKGAAMKASTKRPWKAPALTVHGKVGEVTTDHCPSPYGNKQGGKQDMPYGLSICRD